MMIDVHGVPADAAIKDETSYRSAFAVLKNCVERMKAQNQPDIDALAELLPQASQAYRICKERISAVEAMLAQSFDEDDSPQRLITSENERGPRG
jgi:exodeoxyribonuclease VII small subunit